MARAAEPAETLERARDVFRRRPETAMQEDAPSVARWTGGLRAACTHPNGCSVATDMPAALGGPEAANVTAGWLLRSALAACAVTTIAIAALRRGIVLRQLEVRATSWSDTRGVLDMPPGDGGPFDAAPQDMRLHIVIAADGMAAEALRAFAEEAAGGSAVALALRRALPLRVEVA